MNFFNTSYNCYTTNFFSPPCCFAVLFFKSWPAILQKPKNEERSNVKNHPSPYAKDRKLHLNHLQKEVI